MKILIAEDEPVSRRLLEANLEKWGYDVVVTCDGKEAWQVLQEDDPPRLVILDWMMPGMDGLQVCRLVRNEEKEPYTYIILLTAMHQHEDIISGMDAGADDYITKPFQANELRARVRAGSRIIDLQNELIAAREALRDRATRDHLTGLWNHGEILGILGQELERGQREGNTVGVIMVDCDHFKLINDTYGHVAGDAVLKAVAAKMLSTVRSYDSVGRYGGEEFIIVLPGCDIACVNASAERLRRCIEEEAIIVPEGTISATISLGAATSSNEARLDLNGVVKAADAALYRAKENGRNRVELFIMPKDMQ